MLGLIKSLKDRFSNFSNHPLYNLAIPMSEAIELNEVDKMTRSFTELSVSQPLKNSTGQNARLLTAHQRLLARQSMEEKFTNNASLSSSVYTHIKNDILTNVFNSLITRTENVLTADFLVAQQAIDAHYTEQCRLIAESPTFLEEDKDALLLELSRKYKSDLSELTVKFTKSLTAIDSDLAAQNETLIAQIENNITAAKEALKNKNFPQTRAKMGAHVEIKKAREYYLNHSSKHNHSALLSRFEFAKAQNPRLARQKKSKDNLEKMQKEREEKIKAGVPIFKPF